MPNTTTTTTTDGHDEVNDVYPTLTNAERLTRVERELGQLRRMLQAHSWPYGRAVGGAIDIDAPGAHARRWSK